MIDPRPYTYEYRKPRLNNPTFQSSNLYESLYHLRIPSKNEYFVPQERQLIQERKPQKNYDQPRAQEYNPEKYTAREKSSSYQAPNIRQQSIDMRERVSSNMEKYPQRSSSLNRQRSENMEGRYEMKPASQNSQNSGAHSHLSNYGQNLMRASQFDRYSVFQKQQKNFNIINCYPKQLTSSLRVFPKLTLQDKLIERGKYFKV